MIPHRRFLTSIATIAGLCLPVAVPAQKPSAALPALDAHDIGGVVRGPKGPEVGVWVMEGGKGSRPLAVHFQLRPDPLAK
jgi:hypothetical protein